jgi:hypothetical protein
MGYEEADDRREKKILPRTFEIGKINDMNQLMNAHPNTPENETCVWVIRME